MRLMWLQAFRAVMQTGTVTGAAELMLRTQPQVSRMITSLEKSVGLKLFDRMGRKLVPTEQALEFLAYIEPTLQSLDGVQNAAADIKAQRSRPLVVSVEPFLMHALVPHAVETASRLESAKYAIDLCVRGLGLWMSKKSADIGVVALPFAQSDMVRIPFAQVRVVAALPADHRLAKNSVINLTDLRHEAFIAFRSTTLLRAQVDMIAAKSGVILRPNFEVSTGILACELVSRGLGITLSDPIVATSFADRGVVVRPISEPLELTYGFLKPTPTLSEDQTTVFMKAIADTAMELGAPYLQLHPDWLRICDR
ncbi:LysR substrate-binding domain-containing protein [Pelagibius sp.]|uniref:LysR substrate-binding domain-containing protein n=1 Tax=Pelagibius sp. TaxID=1931238 RepID=UPI003BB21370